MPIAIAGLGQVLTPPAPLSLPTRSEPLRAATGTLQLSSAGVALESSSRFALTLRTQEGDTVTMSVSRQDNFMAVEVAGGAAGWQARLLTQAQESSEAAALSVTGDLSAAESQAVARVLSDVVGAAERFFAGDSAGAMAKLGALHLDSRTLLDLSLDMSVRERVDYSAVQVGRPDGPQAQLQRLAARDDAVGSLLQDMANGQRQLIRAAREVFEPASAVRLVKGVLPPVVAQLASAPVGAA